MRKKQILEILKDAILNSTGSLLPSETSIPLELQDILETKHQSIDKRINNIIQRNKRPYSKILNEDFDAVNNDIKTVIDKFKGDKYEEREEQLIS